MSCLDSSYNSCCSYNSSSSSSIPSNKRKKHHKHKEYHKHKKYNKHKESHKKHIPRKSICDDVKYINKYKYPLTSFLQRKFSNLEYRIKRLPSCYHITQEDFRDGTFRIQKSGYYKLIENITFNPNKDTDFRPGEKYLSNPAYHLGFFAAITIETSDVLLDLNGYTITASSEFVLAQRFFSIIELANQPFIPGQGPGNFGNSLESAKNCVIMNGTIGRSSHHGIHGNNNSWIYFKDLIVKDFEVAGIAINGLKNACYSNIQIGPNFKDVPVLGNFSAARFMEQFYNLAEKNANHKINRINLRALLDQVHDVFQELDNGQVSNFLFKTPNGLPDGNNYGILIHVPGVAVNDFIEEDYNGILSKNISLTNVNIIDIQAHINEIIGISQIDGSGVQTDPSGSVFQIDKVKDSEGTPVHNVLADAQIYLARFCLENNIKCGRMNITLDLCDWYEGKITYSQLLDKGYKFKCNGDSMFHVNKGLHGIRLDGLKNAEIHNCNIFNIKNSGCMGDEDHTGKYLISHDQQERHGYNGANTSGLQLSFCKDIKVNYIKLNDIKSDNGNSVGIRLINQCQDIFLDEVEIEKVHAGLDYADGCWFGKGYDGYEHEYNSSYPNKVPNSIGIQLDTNCYMTLKKRCIKGLKAPGCEVPVWTN